MSDNTLDTLKFLLKDSRKLAEQFAEFKTSSQQSLEQFTEFKQQLNNAIADLEERIDQLEDNQSNVGNVAASNFSQSFSNEEIEHLLDLPLEKILDVYSAEVLNVEKSSTKSSIIDSIKS
jgi:hemoglobin-like flavoprotein